MFLKKYLTINSRMYTDYKKNKTITLQRKYSQNLTNPPTLTGWNNLKKSQEPISKQFPSQFDVVIIGAGVIGSSSAFWLKQKAGSTINILVVEKNLQLNESSAALSAGGIRHQFSLKESVKLSLFGTNFIQNINYYLSTNEEDEIDVQFKPFGYLTLAGEKGRDYLKQNHEDQLLWGCDNVLLTASEIGEKFPWLNTEGIALGCLGQSGEGWFDPWTFLRALKNKAEKLGVHFTEAIPFEFIFEDEKTRYSWDKSANDKKRLKYILIKKSDGEIEKIQFKVCIIAAGASSGKITKDLLNLDERNTGLFHFEVPVERRKRYVYCFEGSEGPKFGSPMVIDPSGLYVRREGFSNNHICGSSPTEEEEPSTENLDVDYDYFTEKLWPLLAHRIPNFEALKLKSAWAGYYDYNKFDQNGIVGFHPAYHNLLIATGFSGHGLQHSPGVGRAVSELLLNGAFQTIDISRLNFDRLIRSEPLYERGII